MTRTYDKERTLFAQVAPRIEQELPGTAVLALELIQSDRFCVFIDHPDGVTLDLCQEVTRVLEGYREEWGIDVSSPGLDRPLRTQSHFQAAIGSQVNIRTDRKVGGATKFRGELVAADTTEIVVGHGEESVHIPYALIVRGNLIDEG